MTEAFNLSDISPNEDLGVEPSELSKFSPGLLTFAAVITGFIMVIGLFGNLLTVVALLKCPKVRNVAAAFIISLCIADFLFCAMVLPFAISGFWTRTWSHGGALCQLVPFLRYGNVGVSLLSIALITLNRYIMIAHHSWYGRVYRRHNIALMIVFSWMFAYGMQIPTLIGIWGKFDFDPELGTCSILPDANGRSSKTALFIIAFLVPALLILICYARIFWVVHSSEQRMREHQRSQHSPGSLNNTTDKRSTIKDNRETKARRNEWRITKMVLAIFLSFLVCYLPITIAKVADSHVHYPIFHIAGYLLLYASACVNPIIYVIMNAQYRAAYAAALCCPLARLSGLTSEMERASRVQLQQHTNGAQPSVIGGVESRPPIHGPGRSRGQVGSPHRVVRAAPQPNPDPKLRETLKNVEPNSSSSLPTRSTETILTSRAPSQSIENNNQSPNDKPIQLNSDLKSSLTKPRLSESTTTQKIPHQNKGKPARVGRKTTGSSRSIGPKSAGSLQNISQKTGSLRSTRKTSSQTSIGPRIRFKLNCDEKVDEQTNY